MVWNIGMYFASASTKFKCTRCARCCSFDVSLTDEEMRNFGENVDIKWRTTRKVVRDDVPVCCFLEGYLCKVYKSRPKICRVYPFFAICEEDLKALKIQAPKNAVRIEHEGSTYFITYDDQCPGLGSGSTPNWKEIVAISYLYTSECTR